MFEWRLNPNAFYNSNINTTMNALMIAAGSGTDTATNPPIN